MKPNLTVVVGLVLITLVLITMGCSEKEQTLPAASDQVATTEAVAADNGKEIWQNESFREHMHLHAEKLDELNFALEDGDLEAAKIPANWLAEHDTDGDIQSEWLPTLYRMRTEAKAVESAPDLATARAAATRINEQCQSCHVAVGINAQ